MNSSLTQLDIINFSSLVAELVKQLNEFSKALDTETETIRKNDSDGLTKSNQVKQKLSDSLSETSNKLEASLQPLDTNIIDLPKHQVFSEFGQELQAQVNHLIALTVECHDKNLANGMSIQILSNINQNALDMISGKSDRDVNLYGASGEKTQTGSSKKSLGKA
jgi:flagella synthesis protein FlgN